MEEQLPEILKTRKTRWIIYSIVGIISILLLGVMFHHRREVVRTLLFQLTDSTKYAKDFSFIRFLEVKEGMTEKEVIDLLGQPLSISHPPKSQPYSGEQWYYTTPGETGDYRIVGVVINASGFVTRKFHTQYID